MDRKDMLLKAAYDLLKRSDRLGYVQSAQEIQVRYDDANCDGHCLMNDIAIELDIEDGTEPIPLGPDDE
jgi:allophanate hydrolase subunit 2